MPAFNLSGRGDEEPEPPTLPIRLEDVPFSEAPPSRSLFDALSGLIHAQDRHPSSFDPSLGK